MYGAVEPGGGEVRGENAKVGESVVGESAVNAREGVTGVAAVHEAVECELTQPGIPPLSCACPEYVCGTVLGRTIEGVVNACEDVTLGEDPTVASNGGSSAGRMTTQHGSQTTASSPNP